MNKLNVSSGQGNGGCQPNPLAAVPGYGINHIKKIDPGLPDKYIFQDQNTVQRDIVRAGDFVEFLPSMGCIYQYGQVVDIEKMVDIVDEDQYNQIITDNGLKLFIVFEDLKTVRIL